MDEKLVLTPREWLEERRRYQHTEKRSCAVKGQWFDLLRWENGREEFGQQGEFEWGDNQIQNSFSVLQAAWARAESGYNRINYFAVGSGLGSWDATPPSQPYSQSTLVTETFRKAIPQGDIIFIDPITNLPTGGTPSRKLEITTTLLTSEANGTLREFALFGGNATATPNSGQMVNWVVHYRIDKDSSLEIQRKVRLEFQAL